MKRPQLFWMGMPTMWKTLLTEWVKLQRSGFNPQVGIFYKQSGG